MKGNKASRLLNASSEHLFYVGATIISAIIHFVYSVVVKAQIEPYEYGVYSTCLLLQTYFTYLQLGSLNAFNRDYPQMIGAKDYDRARRCRDSIFTFLLFVFSVATIFISLGIGIIGTAFGIDARYIWGFILCAVLTALTIIENFGSSRVRIDGGFKFTSIVIIAELFSVGIGLILVWIIGYYALYTTTIGSMCIGIILYYKRGFSDIKLGIDKPLLENMLISGLPLLVNSLIWTVVNSIDKFVILGFINTEALGMYSIAQMAFSYMVLIPNAMSQLFYVKLGIVYGATQSRKALNESALKYTYILAIVISFIVLCAYFLITPLVTWIMPSYLPGVKAAQILMLGLAIYAPTMVNSNILTILKKNAALLKGSIYLCISNVICSIGFVLILGATIESVAIGTALSYLIRTIILVIQLKRNADVDPIKMINASIIPVLLISGPGIIINQIVDNIYWGFAISICTATVLTFVFFRKKIISFIREI